jgi:hypothetical protein
MCAYSPFSSVYPGDRMSPAGVLRTAIPMFRTLDNRFASRGSRFSTIVSWDSAEGSAVACSILYLAISLHRLSCSLRHKLHAVYSHCCSGRRPSPLPVVGLALYPRICLSSSSTCRARYCHSRQRASWSRSRRCDCGLAKGGGGERLRPYQRLHPHRNEDGGLLAKERNEGTTRRSAAIERRRHQKS